MKTWVAVLLVLLVAQAVSGLVAYWRFPNVALFFQERRNRLGYALEWSSPRFYLAILAVLMCVAAKTCQALVNIMEQLWVIMKALFNMMAAAGQAVIDIVKYFIKHLRCDVDTVVNRWIVNEKRECNGDTP